MTADICISSYTKMDEQTKGNEKKKEQNKITILLAYSVLSEVPQDFCTYPCDRRKTYFYCVYIYIILKYLINFFLHMALENRNKKTPIRLN